MYGGCVIPRGKCIFPAKTVIHESFPSLALLLQFSSVRSSNIFITLWRVVEGGPYLYISHRAWGKGNQPGAQTPLCWGTAPKVRSLTSDMIVFVFFTGRMWCNATFCPKWLLGQLGQAVRQQTSTHSPANSLVSAMLYSGSICIQ